MEIAHAQQLNVVCRLGGFHAVMSFLRSIGKLMEDAGLAEALHSCYCPLATAQMLAGKNVQRAVRGHFLVQSALYVVLLRQLIEPQSASCQCTCGSLDYLDATFAMFSSVMHKEADLNTDVVPGCITHLSSLLDSHKSHLRESSRTAKLWLQYIDYIQVLKNFIRAERTSNWSLHLQSLSGMLNVFAANGHRNYATDAGASHN